MFAIRIMSCFASSSCLSNCSASRFAGREIACRHPSCLILMPEQKRFEQICDSLAARLENAGITEPALQATLPEVREEITRGRYPELFEGTAAKKAATGKR